MATGIVEEPDTSVGGSHGARSNSDVNPKKATDVRRVLACGTCRKRKLKCDSKRPKCSTCARLGHTCEYDEVRKKSGPKRGYVKSLEARLNQLESLLEPSPPATNNSNNHAINNNIDNTQIEDLPIFPVEKVVSSAQAMPEVFPTSTMTDTDLNLISDFGLPVMDFSWDMVSLGLEEPLPDQNIMDELLQTYFDKIHVSIPMIHRPRFMASLNFAPNSRPPVCLRYIMFAHACSSNPQYSTSAEQFYQKSRKYAEQDEMRGHGECFITVAHAQCWNLIAAYEFKNMYFPRAWMSVGRAGRLVQMLGLHRQDKLGLDVKQTLPPPKDWIDREERRRTFWAAYCNDRYASIGTGWPMMLDETDITTALPSSDRAFTHGTAEQTPMLTDVTSGESTSSLSSYGSVVLLATLFGRNLTHLHRPSADDNDHDLNGDFWKRHRSLDNILLSTALSLPSYLRLPQGINDANIVFCNMSIHTSTICLHQAAIFKADKHKLSAQISAESKRRCLVAADQITSIMRMISHQDLSSLNPFMAFCLYVAARVFVQYLKFKRNDLTVKSSLTFLLHAMQALKVHNALTESFLVQLDVDIEGSGLDIPPPMPNPKFSERYMNTSVVNDLKDVRCTPLVHISDPNSAKDDLDPSTISSGVQYGPADYGSMNSYFGNGSPQNENSSSSTQQTTNNGLTPPLSNSGDNASSRPPSNFPTPQDLHRTRSFGDATSPPTQQNYNGSTQQKSGIKTNQIRVHDMFSYETGTKGAGVVVPDFNMNIGHNHHDSTNTNFGNSPDLNPPLHQQSSQYQNQTQSQQQSYIIDSKSTSTFPIDNTNDINGTSTGLTPGPSGFTPWPSGMTPGGPGDLNQDLNLHLNQDTDQGFAITDWQSLSVTGARPGDWMYNM